MTDADKLAAFNRILAARPKVGYGEGAETDFLFLVMRETRPFVEHTGWPYMSTDISAAEKEIVLTLLWNGVFHQTHDIRRLAVTDMDNRYLCSCAAAWRLRADVVMQALANQGL